jgi:hypothetical protein
MPTYGTMRVAGMRSTQLHGFVVVCVLAFSGLAMAQGIEPEISDVRLAPALIDPAIQRATRESGVCPVQRDHTRPSSSVRSTGWC